MKEVVKEYLYLLDSKSKRKLPLLIFYFLFSSMLDVVGIGLIGLFLALLTDSFMMLHANTWLRDFLGNWSQKELIIISGISILIAFIFKALIALWIQKENVNFCQTLYVRLATRMMRAYQYAPYIYHLQNNSNYSLTRVGQTNTYANVFLYSSITLISNLLIGFFILGFLLIEHPIPTLLLIAVFLLIVISQDWVVKKHLTKAGRTQSIVSAELTKSVLHGLGGLKEIRILGKEEYFLNRFIQFGKEYAKATKVISVWGSSPRYLVENGIAIFIIGLSLGGVVIGYNYHNIVSLVGMFAVAGTRLLPTVTQLISCINSMRSSYPTMKYVYDDLHELNEVEKNSLLSLKNNSNNDLPFRSEILIDNITFNYPSGKHSALLQTSMRIIKGQSIGIVGPSGAGKSTLVNIVLGLLTPQSGRILIDGNPITKQRDWLNHLAYIPQSIFLLDDSLRRNIAMGIEDNEINEEQLLKVVRMAQLTEVIAQLPNGIDTIIGENGVRLSGGQRQRVALARALYHERDVIVMDEATSSLDNETEKEVINSIKCLKGQKTLIVIAHRLSTVEHCDILYRLEKGRVTAVGSFQEVVGSIA